MGLFGGTKQSSASSTSGIGAFTPKNTVESSAPMLDFSDPVSILSAFVVVVILAYAYKRFK